MIRGAAGARYGPDAMGGVTLVEPPEMRTEEGVGGKALTAFATNGLRPYGAVRLDGVFASAPNLSLRAEGTLLEGRRFRARITSLGIRVICNGMQGLRFSIAGTLATCGPVTIGMT